MRKIIYRLLFALPIVWASSAWAAEYTLMVPLPGLDNTTGVNIAEYLKAIYSFMIAIMAILALVMIVLGGMKYITAVGNPGRVGAARATISNAILGLLIGLFSWIILITLNPDLQFVRQPGAAFQNAGEYHLLTGCGSIVGTACVCKDGTTGEGGTTPACDLNCYNNRHCGDDVACIAPGSAKNANSPGYDERSGRCECRDSTTVPLTTGTPTCSAACRMADRCGSKFLVLKLNMNHAQNTDDNIRDIYITNEDDSLWNFNLTDNGSFGDFAISAKNMAGENNEKFNCAILVQNEVPVSIANPLGADHHYIYWVHEGQAINAKSTEAIYYQILKADGSANYKGCCEVDGAADCAIDNALWGTGDCNRDETDKVLKTVFGDQVRNRCEDCSFARWEGETPTYRPEFSITCRDGNWQ